jgi:hypothetical protein
VADIFAASGSARAEALLGCRGFAPPHKCGGFHRTPTFPSEIEIY